jgi:two-component system response regulator HydG
MMTKEILVVDDEESIRYTFNFFLSEEGYQVSCAENYDEGVACLNKIDFDLIFVDIVLVGKTGIDLLKVIRQKKPHIPVIMITGLRCPGLYHQTGAPGCPEAFCQCGT